MKNSLLIIISILLTEISLSQTIVQKELKLKSKTANYKEPYIFKDGSFQIVMDNYIYKFDSEGILSNDPSAYNDSIMHYMPGAIITKNASFISNENDVKFEDRFINGKRYITEYKIGESLKSKIYYPINNDLKATKLLSKSEVYRFSNMFQTEDGKIGLVEGYFAKAPAIAGTFPKTNFNESFVVLYLLDLKTKIVDRQIFFINKMKNGKDDFMLGGMHFLGYNEGNLKLGVETRIEGKSNNISSTNIDFWNYNINSKQENLIKTFTHSFEEPISIFDLSTNSCGSSDKNVYYLDIAWSELKTKCYTSNHKFLRIDEKNDVIETTIKIPESVFCANGSKPFKILVGETKNKRYFISPLLYDPEYLREIPLGISFNEKDEIEYKSFKDFTVYDEYYDLLFEDYENEDLVKEFLTPSIKNTTEITPYGKFYTTFFSRMLEDGTVVFVSLEYVPEAVCVQGNCEIKKMIVKSIRIKN